ncbi:hypothetical protein MLD38_037854 [Melastoma candidum]|uniref:Uncharacterized protein n=1 Tax=Melastoma candidum TaxID=119954 RepID=A0ACB9LNB3_9MYRT|nr:hypothetical protein MLD38_037854 [Melastoma candidum]
MLMIWSAYFLSDWAAIFTFGLISNARLKNPTSPLQVDQDLLAFCPISVPAITAKTPSERDWRWSYFQIFRGLVVDMMPEYSEWLESRDCFLNKDARETFEILKMELKLFYEVFYTKVLAANFTWGVVIRSLAFYNVLVALIIFCLIEKTGIQGVDVRITYSLLAGVIALDSASEIQLVWSNWSKFDTSYAGCQMLGHGLVLFFIVGVAMTCIVSCFDALCCRTVLSRPWSQSIGAVSILARAFEESSPSKGSKLGDYWRKINGTILAPF